MEAALTPPSNIVTHGIILRDNLPANIPERMFPNKVQTPKASVLSNMVLSNDGTQLRLREMEASKYFKSLRVTDVLGCRNWYCSNLANSSGNHRPIPKNL